MAEQRITITIDGDGKISASTSGFKGDVCMKKLQEILGAEELFSEVDPQDEFYVHETAQEQNTLHQGGY